jgi:hypothetical protein
MFPQMARETGETLGFIAGIPFFLRNPIPAGQALPILRRRLDTRAEAFLQLMSAIFRGPGLHPYRRLLRQASCEAQDVERLVGQEGLEGALASLYKSGVYLTVEEFKGRCPVVRGSLRLSVDSEQVRNKVYSSQLMVKTSGSRGAQTPVAINLKYIRNRSVNAYLNLKACGGLRWTHGLWAVPGGSAIVYLLEMAGFGRRPARWFSQVHPEAPGLHLRYRWSARAVRMVSLVAGLPLPRITYVPLDDPQPIITWMVDCLGQGETPHLFTYTSSGIRLSLAAQRAGISLSGARITITGEPVTRLRLDSIQRCGIRVFPRYGSAESGTIGYGCLHPCHPDEVHVLTDRLAVIQGKSGVRGGETADGPLFVTTLDPVAPFFLLNVSLGDEATIAEGKCGCLLERHGWMRRIHSITSPEKLTGEGMMFLRGDVSRVVDEVLPRRFGGSPTHYQLVEEDDDWGRPRLRLLIHPDVGPIDSGSAARALLEEISVGNGVERLMGLLWRDACLIRVERRPPIPTRSGKIMPVVAGRSWKSGWQEKFRQREANPL